MPHREKGVLLMNNREKMEVKKSSRVDRGSCSFCYSNHTKVYEVFGPGGTLVRFCKACVKELNKQVKEIER